MLVLSRQRDEIVRLLGHGFDAAVTVVDIRGDKVRFGIEADRGITVLRGEMYNAALDYPITRLALELMALPKELKGNKKNELLTVLNTLSLRRTDLKQEISDVIDMIEQGKLGPTLGPLLQIVEKTAPTTETPEATRAPIDPASKSIGPTIVNPPGLPDSGSASTPS